MASACPVQRLHAFLSDFWRKAEVLQSLLSFRRSATTSISPFLGDGRVETHLVHDIDKGLGVALLKTTGQINRLPVREGRLDKRCEFTLRMGTTDQTVQGSFTRRQALCWC